MAGSYYDKNYGNARARQRQQQQAGTQAANQAGYGAGQVVQGAAPYQGPNAGYQGGRAGGMAQGIIGSAPDSPFQYRPQQPAFHGPSQMSGQTGAPQQFQGFSSPNAPQTGQGLPSSIFGGNQYGAPSNAGAQQAQRNFQQPNNNINLNAQGNFWTQPSQQGAAPQKELAMTNFGQRAQDQRNANRARGQDRSAQRLQGYQQTTANRDKARQQRMASGGPQGGQQGYYGGGSKSSSGLRTADEHGNRGIGRGSRNIGNVDYSAIEAYNRAPPAVQAQLAAQGMAPSYSQFSTSSSQGRPGGSLRNKGARQPGGFGTAGSAGSPFAEQQAMRAQSQAAGTAWWEQPGNIMETSQTQAAQQYRAQPQYNQQNGGQMGGQMGIGGAMQGSGYGGGGGGYGGGGESRLGNTIHNQNTGNNLALDQLRQRAAAGGDLDRFNVTAGNFLGANRQGLENAKTQRQDVEFNQGLQEAQLAAQAAQMDPLDLGSFML